MLAGDPWTWFQSFDDVPRIPAAELAATPSQDQTAIGPHELVAGEWIVQLTEGSARRVHSLDSLNNSLDQSPVDFTVISGLGSPGLALLRGRGVTSEDVEWALASHEDVVSFSRNSIIEGQATPQDPEFAANLLPGISEINAPAAWDQTIGSSDVVVGVVDGGIDPTHPDLFLNIWLNQGEIPETLRDQLQDIDGDGLITFYDLNNLRRTGSGMVVASTGGAATVDEMTTDTPFAEGVNASLVEDKNGNGRIDAIDLLEDVTWADGRDTDGNSFFDDFFGVNFRAGVSDPFPSNRPLDQLGHGTHVAGTIGAVGDNGFGVVGVNWQTSLMSLRILDNNNQSDAAAAIKAINYAREMRGAIAYDDLGRLQAGANVRVLNNSWGQPGGFDRAFESAIDDLGDQGILFVAASGNGNLLGVGVDNDRTPFYPASYESDNVIAVAALAADGDRLASFSNYGATSVDIAAPGVGVRSTLPGGGFGPANGTSMATPHVAGAAALIWAALPGSTVDEVKQALLETASAIPVGLEVLSTGGRLDAAAAKDADVFAPSATLLPTPTITTTGASHLDIDIVYDHRDGIDVGTLGDDDLLITRSWGAADPLSATLLPGSVTVNGTTATATYRVSAPGGSWDATDFGSYRIRVADGSIASLGGRLVGERSVGTFAVRIDDPSVLYVSTYADLPGKGSLRDAIIAANAAAPEPRTIILDNGRYTIDIPHQPDPDSTFPIPDPLLFISPPDFVTGWSNETTGDFDVTGNITILGDQNDFTVIDGQRLDRVFKVHPGASLELVRLTVTGGVSPEDQGGGGILSAGNLTIRDVNIRDNTAYSLNSLVRGGGIAVWDGLAKIESSWIDRNIANFGAGVFYGGVADGQVIGSTVSNNNGGGLHSHSDADITVNNSTFSANVGGRGAIFNGKRDGFLHPEIPGTVWNPDISGDGEVSVFESGARNLVPGDFNEAEDIFAYYRSTGEIQRVSVSSDGTEANGYSLSATIDDSGRFVAFESIASKLVSSDTNNAFDVFVRDLEAGTTERVSVGNNGEEANGGSSQASISADGSHVVFVSRATNLVVGDNNGANDIFVFDRITKSVERVSVAAGGTESNGDSYYPTISADGRFVAFVSSATNLVPGDTNGVNDVFLYDRDEKTIKRVSVGSGGIEANGGSSTVKINGDGRFLAFDSTASNLVPTDTNEAQDVFLYDRVNDSLTRISVAEGGVEANGGSSDPKISTNGNVISFQTFSSNLVGPDNAGIVAYDRATGKVEPVSPTGNGTIAFALLHAVSGDGQVVALQADSALTGLFYLYLYDRGTGQLETPLEQFPVSTLTASQVTVAGTRNSRFSVDGYIALQDVLFAGNSADFSVSDPLVNVIADSIAGSDLILPLTREGTNPPMHPLLADNPAIDSGSPGLAGTTDQRGVPRAIPDVGAYEAVGATLSGNVFVDANLNHWRDSEEPGVPGVTVIAKPLDLQAGPTTIQSQAAGAIRFEDLPPGSYEFEVLPPEGWRFSQAAVERVPHLQPENYSSRPVLSSNGQFVAFLSNAGNLVPGDLDSRPDALVFDRQSDAIELVSLTLNGLSSDDDSVSVAISGNGNVVAYTMASSPFQTIVFDRTTGKRTLISVDTDGRPLNLGVREFSVSDDGSQVAFAAYNRLGPNDRFSGDDVAIYDLASDSIEIITTTPGGMTGNGDSNSPVFSGDGRFIVFESKATDLIDGDTNAFQDIFIHDRQSSGHERISLGIAGAEANGDSDDPVVSTNGRFVAFLSDASNLVNGDGNGVADVFIRDRMTGVTERVSVASTGEEADGPSYYPSLSGDGRFVVFASDATNLVEGDTNGDRDIFVFDRHNDIIQRVSVDSRGEEVPGYNTEPAISNDGRTIAFVAAFDLSDEDSNGTDDIYVVANPLIEPGVSRTVRAGDSLNDLHIGLVPDPGSLSGTLYEDLVPNGILDPGEPRFEGWTVYLDDNDNGINDPGERETDSDADGNFRFIDVPSFRDYTLRVVTKPGYERIAPDSSQDGSWNIFLPAAGTVTGRDFGFRRITGTGQSSNSSISGAVTDQLGNPLQDVVVYLDSQNKGVRDPNEPATETDHLGRYSLENLGASIVAVSTQLDGQMVHVSPLGSEFDLEKTPLFDELRPFANPQAIEVGDFNGDGNPDVAVALAEANAISIRLNDGQGGFLADGIDVELGAQAAGPTSLVIGQFNGDTTNLDVAVVNNFSSNVMILKDFNGSGFDSVDVVDVGSEPIDIASVAIGGDDAFLDLVVVNKADNTVQVLRNNAGTFTAKMAVPTDGNSPVALVAGDFGGGAVFHVAVAHAAPANTTTPLGDVRTFRGDASGNLTLDATRYEVGATPTDLVAANFDGDPDGRIDLAVANFASNSISILTGNADGSFTVQSQTLGTASGAFDIAAADMDNDGDIDLVASNLLDRNISIFRNRSQTPGMTDFEPLEAVGLGQFGVAQRMPLALANFDQDQSAPGGRGTIDMVAIPRQTDTLHVLKNRLVDGAHRVELDGLNAVTGRDFVLKPATLFPTLDPIPDPEAIDEGDGQQRIKLTGLAKGRVGGPELRFEAASDNLDLVADPQVQQVDGQTYLLYTPTPLTSGTAVLSVRVIDAGADGEFDTEGEPFPDDVVVQRSVTVTVLPVNDPPTFSIPAALAAEELGAGAPAVVEPGFATGISVGGGADEAASQTLSDFVLTTDNDAAFSLLPTINAAGQLSFRTADSFAGTVTVVVSLADDGGTENAGRDTTTQDFVLTILPVNDPPSITIGGNQSVESGSGLKTVPDFATGFLPGGGADEANQTISDFVVSTDSPGLFSILPDIGLDRTLTFAPAAMAAGVATVTVQVRDSGGTERGGNDLSAEQTFTIAVTGVPDTTPPQPLITSDQPSLTNQNTFEVTIDFGEPVDGFTASDVIADGATVGQPEHLGDGRYVVSITMPTDGALVIDVPAGVATDAAGNANLAATETLTITIDSSALVPQLTTNEPSLTSNGSFEITIAFGEPVTGFQLSDLTVINATASNLQDQGGGQYVTTITSTNDGQLAVLIPAGAAKDAAGNVSLTSGVLILQVDTVSPAPVLRSLVAGQNHPNSFDVDLDFGESVAGLTQGDLTLSSGSIESLNDLGDGRYLIRLIDLNEGSFTLSLVEGAASDLAGNVSLAAEDFNANVLTINATSIVLEGSGNTFFMNQPDSQLDGIQLIDIRGTGDNTLMLSADRIRDTFTDSQILIVSDTGDEVVFDAGWQFVEAIIDDGRLIRRFSNSGAALNLAGPDDFTNPIDLYDVNASGDVTALDALQVINELGGRVFSDSGSNPSGQIRPIDQINPSDFRFYDVNADHRVSALDALRVINELGRRVITGAGESVVLTSLAAKGDDETADELLDAQIPQPLAPAVKNVAQSAAEQPVPWGSGDGANQTPRDTEELEPELVDAALEGLFHD